LFIKLKFILGYFSEKFKSIPLRINAIFCAFFLIFQKQRYEENGNNAINAISYKHTSNTAHLFHTRCIHSQSETPRWAHPFCTVLAPTWAAGGQSSAGRHA